MDDLKLQQFILDWLKNYDPTEHSQILKNVLVVGKNSKPWVEAIRSYVRSISIHEPTKGEIKRACRAVLERAVKDNQ